MDVVEKEGLVMVQGMKFGKKSWKRSWMILFQPSSSGVGRVELYELKDGPVGAARPPGLKRLEKRVVRLSDCLSISPAPEESCPADFYVLDLNTTQRTYTLATPSNQDWLHTLCDLAFPKNEGTSDAWRIPREEDTSMAENELYSSWKSGRYQVKVHHTEAAARCRLLGSYTLHPSTDSLSLLDLQTSEVIYCWPYRLLRRFGTVKEGGVTIEAGRRCESGEGHFTFLSKQGMEIYRVMEEAISRQTGRPLDSRSAPAPAPPPLPPPEPVALPSIPRPPSFDKPRSSIAPPSLPRWNISLPDPPLKPHPVTPQKDIYSVIEMKSGQRAQPKPPRKPQRAQAQGLPSIDSKDEDDDEQYDSIGSDCSHLPDEDSMVYSKLSGFEESFEEASNGRENDSVYSTVVERPPPPPTGRRTLVKTPETRVWEEEEEEQQGEVGGRREAEEGGGSHIVTTASEIPVNFKQTLANILFKDLSKLQIQPTFPTESIDSDAPIYPKNFDM